MAKAAKAVLQQEQLTATADAGYSNGAQFQACEDAGITAFVPPNRGVNNQGDGALFKRTDFTYDDATDSYQCPAGKALALKQHNRGSRLYAACAEDCANCPLKAKGSVAKNPVMGERALVIFGEISDERFQVAPLSG